MSDWWLGLEPAQTTVDCGGARHTLRWERGTLTALDHPDVEGERALAALGGEPCVCVEVLDAWARYAADERVLVAASRGPADHVPREAWGSGGDDEEHGWVSYGSMPDEEGADVQLLGLLALPGALPDRLVATVAAPRSGGTAKLHAALHGRVAAALGVWLGEPGAELSLTVGDAVALTRDGAVIHAQLPFSWIVSVWARGLATVAGRFCLAAETADGRTYELLTVKPDFGAPERVRLQL